MSKGPESSNETCPNHPGVPAYACMECKGIKKFEQPDAIDIGEVDDVRPIEKASQGRENEGRQI